MSTRVPWRLCLLIAWMTVAAYAWIYVVAALTVPSPFYRLAEGALANMVATTAAVMWSFLLIAAVAAYRRLGGREAFAHIGAEISARRPLTVVAFALSAVVGGFAISYEILHSLWLNGSCRSAAVGGAAIRH